MQLFVHPLLYHYLRFVGYTALYRNLEFCCCFGASWHMIFTNCYSILPITEKYWHMRKLGLIGSTKESTHHEAPFDIPASSAAHNNPLQYYHYNHYNFPATYVNHNNRLSFFEKHDRSVAGSSSPSSKESSSEITSSPSPSSSSLTTSLLGGGSHHHHYTRPTPPGQSLFLLHSTDTDRHR